MNREEFENLFTGKFDVAGGEDYERALEFAESHESPDYVLDACAVFFTKPAIFLKTGKTKKGRGHEEGVNDRILHFLPKHEQKVDCEGKWRCDGWESLNMCMIRRIALLYFEYGSYSCKLVKQFKDKYGRPTDFADTACEDDFPDTHKILYHACERFVFNKTDHLSHRVRQLCSKGKEAE